MWIKLIYALLAVLSFGAMSTEYRFQSDIREMRTPSVLPVKPVLNDYIYVQRFDTSAPGAGNFSLNDTLVSLPAANAHSKPSFPILKSETKEARVRFSVGGANYANGGYFRGENGNAIIFWYNLNNTLYVYDDAGGYGTIPATQGSVMELRLKFTGEFEFLVNDQVVTTGMAKVAISDAVYFVVFEGSSSTSSLRILPE
jgi:hypothetical protein